MQRRTILLAGSALLASSTVLRAQGTAPSFATLRFVPQADLAVLDPIWTTATVTTRLRDGLTFHDGSPAVSLMARGLGTTGWFGWWQNAEAEHLVQAWLDAPEPSEQLRLAGALNLLVLREVGAFRSGSSSPAPPSRKACQAFSKPPAPIPGTLGPADTAAGGGGEPHLRFMT